MDTMPAAGATCPISSQKVSGSAARVTGLLAVALFTPARWVLALLAVDFAIKVFLRFRFSPLCVVSRLVGRMLRLSPQLVDAAPKRFAAALGLGFSLAGLLFGVAFTLPLAYSVVVGMFAVCAALEGFAGFCVGCTIYRIVTVRRPAQAT
jgi:hypothetical protein